MENDKIYLDGSFDDQWYETKISGIPPLPRRSLKVCSTHKPMKLGYVKMQDYADKMDKKGIKQTQCPACKHWFFPNEL